MVALLAVSLRVFGPGPVLNLGAGDAALTNAAAHLWFGLACPLVLQRLGLKRWQSGVACGAAVLGREAFFHGNTPGPEVRTDLLSGLVPILVVSL